MDIVSLGEALIDLFPAEKGRPLTEVSAFRPVPGGAPANLAVAAARLGAASAFIGKVGDDPFGHHLATVLAQQGVETRGMRFDAEARTGLNFHAQVDEHTSTHLFYRNPSADMRLHADELDHDLLQGTRTFAFGSISLIQEPSQGATHAAIELVRGAGALIAFDVNYRHGLWPSPAAARERVRAYLPLVDVLKLNQDEAILLTGARHLTEALQRLQELGPELCVVTLGPQGCAYQHGGQCWLIPGFQVQAVEATGCGDAFTATMLVRLVTTAENWRSNLAPEKLATILQAANAAGALTSLKQGVFAALPTTSELEQFLAREHALPAQKITGYESF